MAKQKQFATLLDKEQLGSEPKPSGARGKHVGGYFDPAVAKQLRLIAAAEDTTLQALLSEALNLLFKSRGKPAIAQ